jgi:hypothetical protein
VQLTKPLQFFFSFTLLICLNTSVKAQSDTTYNPDHLYQPQQLHADLAFLKSVLEEAHPSLYRYTLKDTLDTRFAEAEKQLNMPLTDIEFWKVVAPVVAVIRSGHTVIYPSAGYVEWYNKHLIQRLPLSVYVANGHMYAAKFPKKTEKLFRGADITAIDGHDIKFILSKIKPYLSPEGYYDQFVDFRLESSVFSEIYGQVFGFKPKYDVSFIDSSGITQQITLNAVKTIYGYSIDKGKDMMVKQHNELEKSVEVNYFPNVPATIQLKIKSLTYLNGYKNFDYGFFKRLQDEKIKNLIIDFRGNGGGYISIISDLLSYLLKGSPVPANIVTAVTDGFSFDTAIVKHGSNDFPANYLVKAGKRTYMLKTGKYIYPSPSYIFNKNVYLLIDKGTFSAASIFAVNLRENRNVTIIGEESGGGEFGTDGYEFSIVKLPVTGLLLRLPQFWVETVSGFKNKGHGIMPDITVVPTVAQRADAKDVALDKTLQLITDKK